ncbi:MAG: hypothetical protein M1570_03445 [Chloroflexi bacterium]|nr:hypothetical protein [Chloroflexota bacterium]
MRKMRMVTFVVTLLCFLLLTSSAFAMSSTNYKLDWFVPGTSGGGGKASSTHYAVDLTVGQTAIVKSTSTNFGVGLGYWYGTLLGGPVYMPLIVK